jgi:biotin operon repressor
MPNRGLTDDQARQAAEAYKRMGSEGNKLIAGLNAKTFDARVRTAIERGLVTRADRKTVPADTPMPAFGRMPPIAAASVAPAVPLPKQADSDGLRTMLAKGAFTVADLVDKLQLSRGTIIDAIDALKAQGINVQEHGDRYSIQHAPAPRHQPGDQSLPEYKSRPDGTYLFGFTSDNHLCSKYSREDALDNLYDRFAEQGVDRVFNAGNWIDGEARFNVHDLLVHGMDAQVRYLAEHYPQRPGIVTHAIAGDDHEGWYCQREGVDIGRYAERAMRDAGRTDWVDLGYMEAFIRLVHAKTGASTMLHNMHPGGGSAYAESYTVQKIVEAYAGGEKPAVLLAGHYHKLGYNLIRNVHCIQTGCTQDQTPFARKKKLNFAVGGGICKLTQDAETGAIVGCRVELFPYFVRGYYNNRWSHSGGVQLAERVVA